MGTRRYSFAEEPRGAAYRALIEFVAGSSTIAGLVVHARATSAQVLLHQLVPLVIDDQAVSSWPGTESTEAGVRLVRVRITTESTRLLLESVKGLYDWRHPNLPEDLCAWRPDGSLVLASIAHEQDGWLDLDDAGFGRISKLVELVGDPR